MDIHRVKRDRLRGQPQVLRELLASCQVDQGNAPDWVEAALADGVPSVATMVYHSVVWQYLWTVDRARFERVMAVAGEAATHNKPLAWLRFEPLSLYNPPNLREYSATLNSSPPVGAFGTDSTDQCCCPSGIQRRSRRQLREYANPCPTAKRL